VLAFIRSVWPGRVHSQALGQPAGWSNGRAPLLFIGNRQPEAQVIGCYVAGARAAHFTRGGRTVDQIDPREMVSSKHTTKSRAITTAFYRLLISRRGNRGAGLVPESAFVVMRIDCRSAGPAAMPRCPTKTTKGSRTIRARSQSSRFRSPPSEKRFLLACCIGLARGRQRTARRQRHAIAVRVSPISRRRCTSIAGRGVP